MVTLEQVEKLREYAKVSYEEAKTALENAGGDILQALIDLEKQGKVAAPEGGGQYTSYTPQAEVASQNNGYGENSENAQGSRSFRQMLNQFRKWLGKMIRRANENFLVIKRNDELVLKLPVTILVLALFLGFWFVIPMLIIGLFLNFRYSFIGPDLGNTKVNEAMDSVAKVAEDIKQDIKK